MNLLLDLFFTFARVGLVTFGGGYAMIALIEDTCVEKKQWITHDEMMNIIVVAESTPGPIMVNLATYVGSSQAGILGSLAATLAVVLPSFIIILLVTAILKAVLKNPCVHSVLRGLKPCMIGIILATGVYIIIRNGIVIQGGKMLTRPLILTLALGTIYFGSRKIKKGGISPILLICLSEAAGIAAYG